MKSYKMAKLIAVCVVLCLVGFYLGFQAGSRHEIKEQLRLSLAAQNQDADTVNPRLSDEEMFTISAPLVSATVRKDDVADEGFEDADTVNAHVPGATDIGAEIMAANNRQYKK
jgi:hypothetical protein